MKTAYFLVAFLALSVASWAGDEGFKSSRARSAMRQYDAEVEKAKQEATRKIEAARKKYQATLDREVRTATRRGDLDEANKLNAEKKKVQMPVTVEGRPEQEDEILSRWHRDRWQGGGDLAERRRHAYYQVGRTRH
jgi:hypothetical protein